MKRLSSLLCVCLWLCLSMAVVAQDTRVTSQQILATSRAGASRSTIPSDQVHADIRTDNLVTDGSDPLHSCYNNDTGGTQTDSAGSYTMFTRIVHPGGELFISTGGSGYDTVMSLFTYVDAGQPLGTALACNDDQTPGSVYTSFIDVNLPAGQYLVMISRFSLVASASALSLRLNLAYLPEGTRPANDNPNTATPLTTHQALSQTDVHFATDSNLEELLNTNCAMYNSVWYTYTAPAFGEYQFTSHGSVMQVQSGASYSYATTIGVYTEYFNNEIPATEYLLAGCYSSVNYAAVTDPIYMSPGLTYHIRLGTTYNFNLLPGSKYKIKPVITHVGLSTNDGFNDGLTGWKATKFGVGDGANSGVVTITAGAEKKTLSQIKTSFPSYVKWSKGGMIHFAAGYTYTGTPSGKFTVTIAYTDGRPNTVMNIPFSTSNGGYLFQPVALASTKVKSIKMSAAVNPGSGSSIGIDFMTLDYDRDPSVARAAAAPALAFPTGK